MLDFFTIFSKGGIVLWYFQGTSQLFTPSVNALIKTVILQERTGNNTFSYESLTLKYKLDNEFELVFVVAYQNILQLSYVDKFLTDIQLKFRERYKTVLLNGFFADQNFGDFSDPFHNILKEREEETKQEQKSGKKMKTFEESLKSKKTVSSMIENKKDDKKQTKGKENKVPKGKLDPPVEVTKASPPSSPPQLLPVTTNGDGILDEETRMKNLQKLMSKGKKKSPVTINKSPEVAKRKGKQGTKWENEGSSKDTATLDYTPGTEQGELVLTKSEQNQVGTMKGELKNIDDDEELDEVVDDDSEEDEVIQQKTKSPSPNKGGMFSMFRNLVGSKTLTSEQLGPVLEKMKDHLISKNVAADIAEKLCQSVGAKLEGKILGTFGSVASTVKNTLQESCVQILSPRRRVDILRDALEAKQQKRPYVITFCGVNGVGKSTNLAKVCFWLVENGLSVLIAACDTFRSGAVEQLRTHVRKLNALHPKDKHGREMVQLYERGYGKDSAGIAMEAVSSARDYHIDIVLIDTAGRMQDNEPLMRALSKLVKVNQPDLVLFVGEALVGNEAVDQLLKFNQALADHSQSANPRLIDGIILTKFDTIDDKVGAAISMTYTTGQPIVFVGTGQTYSDLRNLNAKAVVSALLKP
ncbi:signal recognition particle receptor subunit alpha-like [Physella acuta]|uniref:signal recognition particle receptor subunit alpha-like n=1 Tax=Physella acuta TaxID=109671 RepID=UPI0027DB7C29|nr:signal recognition particle receptor subunit alpha-like [Physella acuta]